LKEEAAKKEKKAKKFPLGKEAETLTEWMMKVSSVVMFVSFFITL
jgi:hypothetical protein